MGFGRSEYCEEKNNQEKKNKLHTCPEAVPLKKSRIEVPPVNSILVGTNNLDTITNSQVNLEEPWRGEDMKVAQATGSFCAWAIKRLESDPATKRKYQMNEEGVLKTVDQKMVIRKQLQTKIFKEIHVSHLGGHKNQEQTLTKLKEYFWWLKINKHIAKYCRICLLCQQMKGSTSQLTWLLNPLPLPSRKWELGSLNLITELPKRKREKDAIVVFVDRLSKIEHFIPIETTTSTSGLA